MWMKRDIKLGRKSLPLGSLIRFTILSLWTLRFANYNRPGYFPEYKWKRFQLRMKKSRFTDHNTRMTDYFEFGHNYYEPIDVLLSTTMDGPNPIIDAHMNHTHNKTRTNRMKEMKSCKLRTKEPRWSNSIGSVNSKTKNEKFMFSFVLQFLVGSFYLFRSATELYYVILKYFFLFDFFKRKAKSILWTMNMI